MEVPRLRLRLGRWPLGRRAPLIGAEEEVVDFRLRDAVVDALEEVIVGLLLEKPHVVAQRVSAEAETVERTIVIGAVPPRTDDEVPGCRVSALRQRPVALGAGEVVVEPAADLERSELAR